MEERKIFKTTNTDIRRNDIGDSLQNYNGTDKNATKMSINNGNVQSAQDDACQPSKPRHGLRAPSGDTRSVAVHVARLAKSPATNDSVSLCA